MIYPPLCIADNIAMLHKGEFLITGSPSELQASQHRGAQIIDGNVEGPLTEGFISRVAMNSEAKSDCSFLLVSINMWFAIFVTNLGAVRHEVRFDRVLNLADPVTYNGVRVGRVTEVTCVNGL